MTWAISRNPLRPGALVTAGDVCDVCHLHPDRAAAERCGALMGGAPDLVRLEKHTARVYRVLWSLSDVAGGELRKPAPPPAPAPAKRPGAVRSWPGNVRISGPCGGARRLGAADGGRSMTATWADVERAVSGRPGRGPRNGRVSDGDCPRAVTPLDQLRLAFPTTRFRASSVACGGSERASITSCDRPRLGGAAREVRHNRPHR